MDENIKNRTCHKKGYQLCLKNNLSHQNLKTFETFIVLKDCVTLSTIGDIHKCKSEVKGFI